MTVADPTLRVEHGLHRDGVEFVIGADEVGRGAIAGPVAVGLSLIETRIRKHPSGLRDSKMLSEPRREELAPLARIVVEVLGGRAWRARSRSTRSAS